MSGGALPCLAPPLVAVSTGAAVLLSGSAPLKLLGSSVDTLAPVVCEPKGDGV